MRFGVLSLLIGVTALVVVVDSVFISQRVGGHGRLTHHGTTKLAIFESNKHQSARANVLHVAPDGMKWFVKTEQFCKPYPQVKPYLVAHREWVRSLREQNNSQQQQIIVSGYRVDENDKPGGGGLMIFAATDHAAAEEFVKNDPLIQNECVDWRLNRWIPETGDICLE